MFSLPTEPLGIGRTIDAGFKLYKASFTKAIGLSCLSSTVVLAWRFLAIGMGATPTDLSQMWNLTWTIPVGFVVLIVYFAFYLALTFRIGMLAAGVSVGIGDAMRAGFRKLPIFVLASLLYGLLSLLWVLSFVPIAFSPWMVIVTIIFALPLTAMLFSMFWYYLCILFDDDGPAECLVNSHHLVWGNWWRSATILTVVFIIYVLFVLAIGVPIAIVDTIVFPESLGQGPITMAADFVATTLLAPLLPAVMVVMFHDLKLRKGGGDIEARLDALTVSG